MKRVLTLIILAILFVGCAGETAQVPSPIVAESEPASVAAAVENVADIAQDSGVSSSSQVAQTTIRFLIDSTDRQTVEPLLELFSQEHPEIAVTLLTEDQIGGVEDEDPGRLRAESADVLVTQAQRETNPEYLLDLTPFIENDAEFNRGDFYPNTLIESEGKVWTIPNHVAYYMLYFNRDLFDQAGVPYPQNGWSTNDFLTIARQVTVSEDTPQWGYLPLLMIYSPLLAAQLESPIGLQTAPRFEGGDVTAGFDWMIDLFTEQAVSPWLPAYREFELIGSTMSLIRENQVAMWEGSNGGYEQWAAVENVGAVAAPIGNAGFDAAPLILGYGISAGTTDADAAWELVEFLSHQRIGSSTSVPARRSVAETFDFWETLPEPIRDATLYSAENQSTPRIWGDLWPLYPTFTQVIDEGRTVNEVFASLSIDVAVDETPIVQVETAATETIAEDATTVLFYSSYGTLRSLRALAEEFHRINPDIYIDVQPTLEVAVGRSFPREETAGADCFQYFADERLHEFVLPVDALLELDGSLSRSDFYPATLRQLVHNNELIGIPASATLSVIAYDRTAFAEAGVPEPTNDWTLQTFLETAQALTLEIDGNQQYGFGDRFYNGAGQSYAQFGVDVVDATVFPPTLDLTRASAPFRWYADLTTLYNVSPNLGEFSRDWYAWLRHDEAYTALLENGQLAMWSVAGGEIPVGARLTARNLGLVTWPTGPSGFKGQNPDVSGYFIDAGTEHREACWQWITFLTEQQEAAAGVPPRISTLQSPEYTDAVGEDVVQTFHTMLENAALQPDNERAERWMGPAFIWLDEGLERVISGKSDDLASEIQIAQEKFDAYRECVIQDLEADWLPCVEEIDPDLISGRFQP